MVVRTVTVIICLSGGTYRHSEVLMGVERDICRSGGTYRHSEVLREIFCLSGGTYRHNEVLPQQDSTRTARHMQPHREDKPAGPQRNYWPRD